MGMPKIAASTSAPMYCLERITATGSTTGDPLGGSAASERAGLLRWPGDFWNRSNQPSGEVSPFVRPLKLTRYG
jgi:hypothetical protein